jgi:TPR repeat protein
MLLKRLLAAGTALSAAALMGGVAAADYYDALRAYAFDSQGRLDRTDVAEAVDMWRKYALAGDILSRQILGDLYSHQVLESDLSGLTLPKPEDTGVVPNDPVEALAWYSIAATHDFDDFNQVPELIHVNARAKARARLPQLRAEMTGEQVAAAEQRVVEILSAGSAFDLYRIGVMHQTGEGLPKGNKKALMFFKLAQSRNFNSSAAAADAAGFLMSIMSRDAISEATKLAEEWEPPLPDHARGRSPRQVAIEEDLIRLRALQAGPAFERLEDQFKGNEHLLQNALAALGLYLGQIDGKVGPGTRDAIRRFQYSLVEEDDSLTLEEKKDVQTGVLTVEQKLALIRRAAERQHPQSQYVYGVMHAEGIGVPVSGAEAEQWLKQSADYGYSLAHYALGEYYAQGIQGETPLKASLSQASFHYGQAVGLGYQPARDALVKLNYEYNTPR